MAKSYNSWSSLNESTISKGKQTVLKVKGLLNDKIIKWKVESPTEFKTTFKRMPDLTDNEKLTNKGAGQIVKVLNGATGFVHNIGLLNSDFFSRNVLVYDIKRDSNKIQTVQFKIILRSSPEAKGLEDIAQFISTVDLAAIAAKNNALKNVVTKVDNTKVSDDEIKDEIKEPDSQDEEEAKGTKETDDIEAGTSFAYTFRTNGKTYKMTFTATGAIKATLPSGGRPQGTVSIDDTNKIVQWITDEDEENAQGVSNNTNDSVFFVDGPILNKIDHAYLLKIFTDAEFRNEQIGSSPKSLDIDSIKEVLYYNSTKELIFTPKEQEVTDVTLADVDSLKKKKTSSAIERYYNTVNT